MRTKRFVCPKCGGSIDKTTLVDLPRDEERGPGGMWTWVVCPICNKRTIGAYWRVKGDE